MRNNKIPLIIFSTILILSTFNTSTFASEITGTLSGGFIGTRTVVNPDPTNMATEVTAGLLSIQGADPAATANVTFNVDYILKDGEAIILIPTDTVITKTGGGNLDFTTFGTTNNTIEIKNEIGATLGSIKIGVPNISLTFSKSITVTIPVGTAHNGESLTAYYRSEGSTEWLIETTCIVANGNCTFQTTHATTFAARENATSGSSSSSSSSSSSNNSNSTCASEKPSSIPDLFQVNVNDTTAKIFFTPISNTTSFYFSFSTSQSAEEYGAEATLAREGVQNFTINMLKPNTPYYFKVRGQVGCMPGEWSNIVRIKTSPKGSTKVVPFYKYTNIFQKVVARVAGIFTQSTAASKPETKKKSVTEQKTELPAPAAPSVPKKNCILWWCY